VVSNPLLNLFTLYTPEMSKALRCVTYYLRIITMLAFTSIFASSGEFDGIMSYLLDVINIWILLLPYFTVIPINIAFEYLIQIPEASSLPGGKIPKWIKIKHYFGIFLGILSSLGCTYIIFVLAANKSYHQNRAWKYDFIFTFCQDNFIVPILFFVV